MNITSRTAEDSAKLHASYCALGVYEQCIVKGLAIVYPNIGVSKFNHLLSHLSKLPDFSRGVRLVALKPAQRSRLVKKGFIIYDSNGLRVNPLLRHSVLRACVEEGLYPKMVVHIAPFFKSYVGSDGNAVHRDTGSQVLDDYLLNGAAGITSILGFNKNPQVIFAQRNAPLVELCFLPFDRQAFLALPQTVQYQAFATWFANNTLDGHSNEYLLSLLTDIASASPGNVPLCCLGAEIHFHALRFDQVAGFIHDDHQSCYGLQLQACMLMLRGETTAALEKFGRALEEKNKLARRKQQYLLGTLGIFHKLCLITLGEQNVAYYAQAQSQINAELREKHTDEDMRQVLYVLNQIINDLSSGKAYVFRGTYRETSPYISHVYHLCNAYGVRWSGGKLGKAEKQALNDCASFFSAAGYVVFATMARQLLAAMRGGKSAAKSQAQPSILYFPDIIQPKAEWERSLDKLLALNPAAQPPATGLDDPGSTDGSSRLIWEMGIGYGGPSFSAREQKKTARGWSKGRVVSLKRLASETASFSYLTEADRAMCDAIDVYEGWDYYRSQVCELDGIKALKAAAKLDNLFLSSDLQNPIEIIEKEPELLVNQEGDQLILSIANLPKSDVVDEGYSFYALTDKRYGFTEFNQAHLKVAAIIGEGGLSIPLAAKEKALESIRAIAPLLNIQSDIDELDTGLETVPCDEHLVVNIQPFHEGLEFTCLVMPFGEQGPAFKPIAGNAQLTTELADKRVATQRDLLREQRQLDILDEHCPAFLDMPDNVLRVEDPQAALEALEQLEQLHGRDPAPLPLLLRWPKGKSVKLSNPLTSERLSLAIGKDSEWFDISGDLQVDEGQVVTLRALLDLVQASRGRFISLDNGQVLALSRELRERLEQLHHATDAGKFHALASLQVAEATAGMRMKPLHAWEEQTQRMHEANRIEPALPSTLQAELRDYQREGFDWLSRLAHWNAGACLADDMGLGKTLQALALLLSRAEGGPSLVLAPTSVCYNWQQEAVKFAPTLNLQIFSELNGSEERQRVIKEVGSFDCVVISYGLLQREKPLLAEVHWHTIIADEAQALKNPLAKRTQAAYALKGDFKIITTGTPIENNLTELWSLFRFIAPGLLGNIKRFGERYAYPIENAANDKQAAREASRGLKTLIQPFILRRMKSQVLRELPPRTEINQLVELSPKEQNFYEALRRNAVDNIMQASDTANEGERRIRMLAELVKLRQACCNPKLVMPESDLPSAKLEALDELLDELQQNHHKALIFSQFVGHLKIIKQHLDKRGIHYQYLDGATPQKKRKASVAAFQKGEGEVFLISLKAGGSGLNLTAADYVIHMDPWWNPAVEEQASDRAHRMGQKRPVTIYRLIAKNTIEERIVALHQHKRDLADKLLSGNEQASKLSVEEILSMLKETF